MKFCLYTSEQEENIFTREKAKAWRRSDLITEDQLRIMEECTDPGISQTHAFFRLLFFVFICVCASAIVALVLWLINNRVGEATTLIFFGITYYLLAEYVIRTRFFYRYGIEEALAIVSMISLVIGCGLLMNNWHIDNQLVIVIACLLLVTAGFWIYLRFGFLYAILISIIAFCIIPFQLSLPATGERLFLLFILCLILLISLIFDKSEIADFQKEKNTIIQACLLAAIYVTINLRIFELARLYFRDIGINQQPYAGFPPYLYWISYLLTFLIPFGGLYWGIKNRQRIIINVSLLTAFVALSTNKDYLGLKHYAWDPAIMGILLIALSILIKRWLTLGPSKARYCFTAENILKSESHGINLADIGAALTPVFIESQQPIAPTEKIFEEGKSGGGGASRDF